MQPLLQCNKERFCNTEGNKQTTHGNLIVIVKGLLQWQSFKKSTVKYAHTNAYKYPGMHACIHTHTHTTVHPPHCLVIHTHTAHLFSLASGYFYANQRLKKMQSDSFALCVPSMHQPLGSDMYIAAWLHPLQHRGAICLPLQKTEYGWGQV